MYPAFIILTFSQQHRSQCQAVKMLLRAQFMDRQSFQFVQRSLTKTLSPLGHRQSGGTQFPLSSAQAQRIRPNWVLPQSNFEIVIEDSLKFNLCFINHVRSKFSIPVSPRSRSMLARRNRAEHAARRHQEFPAIARDSLH